MDPNRGISKKELREFAFLVGGAFVAFAVIAFVRHKQPLTYRSLTSIGVALAIAGAIAPRTLSPVYSGWMRFAVLLSKVTTPIFMGIVYFAILTPIGIGMRLFGRNPIGATQSGTSWISRAAGERQSSLERQF